MTIGRAFLYAASCTRVIFCVLNPESSVTQIPSQINYFGNRVDDMGHSLAAREGSMANVLKDINMYIWRIKLTAFRKLLKLIN